MLNAVGPYRELLNLRVALGTSKAALCYVPMEMGSIFVPTSAGEGVLSCTGTHSLRSTGGSTTSMITGWIGSAAPHISPVPSLPVLSLLCMGTRLGDEET